MEWLDAFLGSGIRLTTPILLAALACLPTLWTRDTNIGLEGIMIYGAFSGAAFGLALGSGMAAVAATSLAAAAAGVVFGLIITRLNVNVFVAGIVLFVFAGATTVYLLDVLYGVKGNLSDPGIPSLPSISVPGLEDVPVVGALLSGHTVLTWLAVALTFAILFMDRRSVIVRRMRAAGSHPDALLTAGVNVDLLRILGQVWCFVLSALAGIQISLSQLSLFTVGMTGGLGFVALAAAIFSGGRVWLAAVVSVGFGFATALTFQFDKNSVPPEFTGMIPYVAALVGLVLLSRRTHKAATHVPLTTTDATPAPATPQQP